MCIYILWMEGYLTKHVHSVFILGNYYYNGETKDKCRYEGRYNRCSFGCRIATVD